MYYFKLYWITLPFTFKFTAMIAALQQKRLNNGWNQKEEAIS